VTLNPIVMEGLRALPAKLQDMAPVGKTCMDLVRSLSPAVVVIDKSFGLQPVTDWIPSLRGNGRRTSVMVWGHSVNEAEALRMVQAGAQGMIRKTAPLRSRSDCIQAVAVRNAWMDDLMFTMLKGRRELKDPT